MQKKKNIYFTFWIHENLLQGYKNMITQTCSHKKYRIIANKTLNWSSITKLWSSRDRWYASNPQCSYMNRVVIVILVLEMKRAVIVSLVISQPFHLVAFLAGVPAKRFLLGGRRWSAIGGGVTFHLESRAPVRTRPTITQEAWERRLHQKEFHTFHDDHISWSFDWQHLLWHDISLILAATASNAPGDLEQPRLAWSVCPALAPGNHRHHFSSFSSFNACSKSCPKFPPDIFFTHHHPQPRALCEDSVGAHGEDLFSFLFNIIFCNTRQW